LVTPDGEHEMKHAQWTWLARSKGVSSYLQIASFDQFAPAEALAQRLCEDGLEAIARSDTAEQLLMYCNAHPRGQCHVLIPGDKLEAALKRMKELDASEQVLRSAIRCPDCGSTLVEYPQFSRKTILGAVVPAAVAAMGLIERQFYCTACHFLWSPKADPHTVPVGKDLSR